jgi:hypothetical protein
MTVLLPFAFFVIFIALVFAVFFGGVAGNLEPLNCYRALSAKP